MSATDRHISKIRAIRKSLKSGAKSIAEINQDTGLSKITISCRLAEAFAWGFVDLSDNGKWSLDK